MGSFEKLGILVIVVIIVMILTVAIYQWGGAGLESSAAVAALGESPGDPVKIVIGEEPASGEAKEAGGGAENDSDSWLPGVPRQHVVAKGDVIWKLLLRWGLKESFIAEIQKANPKADLKRLQIGQKVRIPDPTNFVLSRKKGEVASGGHRVYAVKQGDNLENIARYQLGSASRAGEIQTLNPGLNPKALQIGQEIKIPVK
jgi:LysM repeat protein